ncbi:MAG: UDP-glucose/GDP-mannose dehydrogenase family protein [candidate division WOR-3 bacterium]
MSNISVIGAGYVGLVTAAGFAELGHNITLIEISPAKVKALKHGELPISEPGLTELWQKHHQAGRISVTPNYIQGLLGAEFVFIAVGTPSNRNGKPDLKWLRSAVKSIAEAASAPLIVVIKSTVPVGTACLMAKVMARHSPNRHHFPIVSNPEFLREGAAVYDFMNPSRVVIGSSDPEAAAAVAALYQPLNCPTVLCDNKTAEMSKYASNVFLATRISFMNELALLCDEYSVDVVKVAEIMGLDPRFGRGYLNAGLGWGGSCLPKDVRGMLHMAKRQGISLHLVKAVERINRQQPYIVLKKLQRLVGSLEDKTIGILGLSFKPDSDDIREARSLVLISILENYHCKIKAFDPLAMEATAKLLPKVTYCSDPYEVARGSDALILVTEWDEFKHLDMGLIASIMKRPVLIDGRNLYDPEVMIKTGFIYEGIGRRGYNRKNLEKLASGGKKGEALGVLSNTTSSSVS